MHISLIDDELILSAKIQKKLEDAGYAVSVYNGYSDFMQRGDGRSHLYIIDISLGDGSGFALIEWLRKCARSKVPILIISGFGDTRNIIYGLEIGGDDYMVKPLIPEVMVARIKALMRRPINFEPGKSITYKNIYFNIEKKETRVGENPISLTRKESMILELFLRERGRVVNREALITAVWGGNHMGDVSDNTINVTLSKIRKKVGSPFSLKTLYNEGYILE